MIIRATEPLPVRYVNASLYYYFLNNFKPKNINVNVVSFLGCWDVLHQSPRASECFFIFNGMVDQAYI